MHFQALHLFAVSGFALCIRCLTTSGRYVGLHKTRTSAQRADAFLPLDDMAGAEVPEANRPTVLIWTWELPSAFGSALCGAPSSKRPGV